MLSFFRKCLLTVVFLLAVLLVITALFPFYINHTKENGRYFSSIASDILKKPVNIQSGKIKIFSLEPEIIISNATFFSEKNKNVLFHLNQAKITIDLSESWEKKSWVIKKIALSNLNINIGGNNPSNNSGSENKALINWIKSQESISLNNVEINDCNNNNLCKPLFAFSAQLTKQETYQRIKVDYGLDAQRITMTGNVQWREDQKNWAALLSAVTIKNQNANFSGNAVVNFDLNQYLSISANGSGNIRDVNITDIQANYNKDTSSFKINGVATGGFLEKLFPGKSYFSAIKKSDSTNVTLHNPNIIGTFIVNPKKDAPIKVKLQRLALHFNHSKNSAIDLNPKEIPALSASVDNFIINGKNLGHLTWQSTKINNGISVNTLKLISSFEQIISRGSWVKESAFEKITLSGIFTSNNFGEWFQRVHSNTRVKNGTLNLKFSLETQGLPNTLFSLKNLKGNSLLKIENLTIANKNQKNGPANFFDGLLNLISLQSISDFLTLDFKALKKSDGFKIYVLKGDINMENGYLKTQDLAMNSAVANINFSGNINLISDQNNLKMIVYPNIIQSQPLGNCPVLFIFRLPVWAWKKISSHFLDPLFHLQYKITGTLEKPVVKQM